MTDASSAGVCNSSSGRTTLYCQAQTSYLGIVIFLFFSEIKTVCQPFCLWVTYTCKFMTLYKDTIQTLMMQCSITLKTVSFCFSF